MKTLFKILGAFLAGAVFFGSVAYGQSIPSQSPWVYNASNQITQIVANSVIKITGLADGCLGLSSGLVVSSGSACGSGGGGGTGVATTSLLASLPVTVTKTTASITFGSLFSTTTDTGLGHNLFVYTNNSGVLLGAASSSLSLPNTALQNSSVVINGTTFNLGDSKTISAASSSLLSDNNIFSGNDIFNNLITGSISGNAGTATKLATGRTISVTGDLAYTSPSFDGSGNVTAAGTLATVNSSVGSFTNANITVNGKGLVTAASSGFAYPFIANATTTALTFGGVTVTGAATGCATFTTGVLSSTGVACGSGSGGSTYPFQLIGSLTNATSTLTQFTGGLTSYASTTIGNGGGNGLTINGNSTTTGNVLVTGTATPQLTIGSTTPWAQVSIHANSNSLTEFPILFAIGSSTATATTTLFSISNTGNTGISSSTPHATLSVSTVAGTNPFEIGSSTNSYLVMNQVGDLGLGTTTPWADLSVINDAQGPAFIVSNSTNTTGQLVVASNGFVGIGTSSPETTLGIQSNSTGNGTPALTIDGTGTVGGNGDMELEAAAGSTAEANVDFSRAGTEEWQLGIQNGGGATGNDFELWDGADNPVFTVNHSSLDVNVGTTTCQGESELCVWGDSGISSAIFDVITSASTTALSVSSIGFATTTLSGLNISGSATSTSNVGFNITSGCFAIANVCITGGGGGGVSSVGLSLPTGFAVTNSPVTTSGTLTGVLQSGYSIKELPSWTVGAAGADFTTIQAALTQCGAVGGGSIYLVDPTYTQGSTGLTWRGSNCAVWGRSAGTTTITFTGATTGFKTNSAAGQYTNDELHGVLIQGNATAGSIGVDWSDMTHGIVDNVQVVNMGEMLHLNDTQNVTFYNSFTNMEASTSQFGINASSTNPVNGNYFNNIFLGDQVANWTGVQINNANGNTFNNLYTEPTVGIAGSVGLKIFDNKLATNNGVFNNTFSNWYDEGNITGVSIALTVNPAAGGIQRNIFQNFTSEANTTDWSVPDGAIQLNTFLNNYDSNFGVSLNTFGGPLGIGTSSEMKTLSTLPYAQLAVNASTSQSSNAFAVSLSTTQAPFFLITNTGNVGVGTSSPGTIFGVQGALDVTTATTSFVGTGGVNLKSGCFAIAGTCITGGGSGVTGGTANMLASWINATTLTATGTPQATAYIATSSAATSTFAGGLEVGTSTQIAGNTNSAMLTVSNLLQAIGGILINTWTNVVNALRIVNAAGTTVLNIDDTSANAFWGVATTSPWATLSVVGDGTDPLFVVATTTTTTASSSQPIFMIDSSYHVQTGGAQPVASTCGTNPVVAGNDNVMLLTTGSTGITECTVTFAKTWSPNIPVCSFDDQSNSSITITGSTTASTLKIGLSVSLTSAKIGIICMGFQ